MTTPTMPDMLASEQIAKLRMRLAEAEETLHAIRSGEVDAITVSTPSGERVYALQGADQPYREMIEAMSEGALNISPDGVVLYCNQFFANLARTNMQEIMGSNLLAFFVGRDQARITTALAESRAGTSRVSAHLLAADGTQVPVNVAMHVLADGGIRSIVIVTSDLTQMVVAQDATNRINLQLEQANRALQMLNLCNTTIIHATDEKQMLTDICHALVDSGGYKLAWIGYAEHDEERSVRPVAWADGTPDYVESAKVSWADDERGRGPTGQAIRSGRMTIVRDTDTDASFGPWREMAQREDFHSSASLPLRADEDVFGALMVYANRLDAFDGQECNTLTELADDVAYCIANLRREVSLAETKALLDNILQSSTKYSIMGEDRDRKVLFWNEGARRNYGYAADEIIGKTDDILQTPEDSASGAVDRLIETANENWAAEAQFQRVRKDGSRFPAQIDITRRDDAAGNPIGYLVISSDISEKRRAEERMREASQYARSLIEASLDPLITISPDGKITDVNHATELITGQIRERLIGSDFAIYFTDPEKARAGYKRVFAKGFVIDYPLAIRHMAGTVTEVLYNASLYRLANGEVGGVFAAARDISRMVPTDLLPTKRQQLTWRHVGFIVAALGFVVTAIVVPTISNNWLQHREQQSNIYQLTATDSRMASLLNEVNPMPARVRAAKIQPGSLGLGYTITYAVAAPNHKPGVIGKEELLSRFANEMAALSTGNCVHLTQQLTDQTPDVSDFIVCPIAGKTGLIGLLFISWDRGDPVPANFDAASAATKQAGSDIATIWAR